MNYRERNLKTQGPGHVEWIYYVNPENPWDEDIPLRNAGRSTNNLVW
jgi:hypothetical protein